MVPVGLTGYAKPLHKLNTIEPPMLTTPSTRLVPQNPTIASIQNLAMLAQLVMLTHSVSLLNQQLSSLNSTLTTIIALEHQADNRTNQQEPNVPDLVPQQVPFAKQFELQILQDEKKKISSHAKTRIGYPHV